jgi:hypothetical protein
VDVKHLHPRRLLLVALLGVGAALVWASGVWAAQLGTTMPGNCVAHTGFGEPDVPGDFRCAGLVLRFHTSGVANAVSPIWAGQWLFTDPDGQFRVGTCTFNRGTHPTIHPVSRVVNQAFPGDPTGQKGAYLAWRYGDSTDPLTAAAVWAVFHHYAQDPAGANYSANPTAPLVPSLGGLAAATGRPDLQARALALDAEANAFRDPWNLSVSARADGVVSVTLLAGTTPVPDRPITVLVGGVDSSFEATTGTDGNATVTVPLPSGTVTVVATADAPGPVQVFRGAPASPNPATTCAWMRCARWKRARSVCGSSRLRCVAIRSSASRAPQRPSSTPARTPTSWWSALEATAASRR